MKIICAWCQADLGEKPPLADSSVTHGMCANCEKKQNEEFDKQEG